MKIDQNDDHIIDNLDALQKVLQKDLEDMDQVRKSSEINSEQWFPFTIHNGKLKRESL